MSTTDRLAATDIAMTISPQSETARVAKRRTRYVTFQMAEAAAREVFAGHFQRLSRLDRSELACVFAWPASRARERIQPGFTANGTEEPPFVPYNQ